MNLPAHRSPRPLMRRTITEMDIPFHLARGGIYGACLFVCGCALQSALLTASPWLFVWAVYSSFVVINVAAVALKVRDRIE